MVSTTSDVPPLELVWSRDETPLEAIERALYALADQLSGTVVASGPSWAVAVHPRSDAVDPAALAHGLRQAVTDQTLRLRIAERTDPIRNLVFALAFSRAPQTEGRASSTAGSNQS